MQNLIKGNPKKKGFTLLEILLVIAAIGILALIVIVAINPLRQLGRARNAARVSGINTLQKALEQYNIDNGAYPTGVTNNYQEICVDGDITDCVDLESELVPTYIAEIPRDPEGGGYKVAVNPDNNKISLIADKAVLGSVISINLFNSNLNPINVISNISFEANPQYDYFHGHKIAVDSDNNIYVVVVGDRNSNNDDIEVKRYNQDYTLDTTFANSGTALIGNGDVFDNSSLEVLDVIIDQNNFYITLYAYESGSTFLLKYNKDTFVPVDFSGIGSSYVGQNVVPRQFFSDYFTNGLKVSGEYIYISVRDSVFKYNKNTGLLDNNFGVAGELNISGKFLNEIDIYNNTLYIVGDEENPVGAQYRGYIGAYNKDTGVLDTSFGGGEILLDYSIFTHVYVSNTGQIYVGSTVCNWPGYNHDSCEANLRKYQPNGQSVTNSGEFDSQGNLILTGDGDDGEVSDILIDDQDNIYISTELVTSDSSIFKYSSDNTIIDKIEWGYGEPRIKDMEIFQDSFIGIGVSGYPVVTDIIKF